MSWIGFEVSTRPPQSGKSALSWRSYVDPLGSAHVATDGNTATTDECQLAQETRLSSGSPMSMENRDLRSMKYPLPIGRI
jgi:hypothetical protein